MCFSSRYAPERCANMATIVVVSSKVVADCCTLKLFCVEQNNLDLTNLGGQLGE